MMKKEERYAFSKKAGSALAVFILILALLMFFAGSTVIGQTETIAQTTFTRVVNSTLTTTSVSTSVQYITVTVDNYTTVNYIGPDDVLVSGKVSTTGVGTIPTQVVFQNESNQTLLAQVTGGGYSISLPNHNFYTIYLKYSTATAGVGNGQCSAGGLVLFFTGATLTASWRC